MDSEDRHFKNTMYNNLGKYFDPYKFNLKFDEYIEYAEKQRLEYEKVKFHDINNIEEKTLQPYQEPVGDIIVGIKNVWFMMFDNIVHFRFMFNGMNNRDIFYLAISLIAIALIYISISFIFC